MQGGTPRIMMGPTASSPPWDFAELMLNRAGFLPSYSSLNTFLWETVM